MNRRIDTPAAGHPPRSHRLSAVFIFALAVLVYANTLGNQFVFDDRTIVEGNHRLRSWTGLPGLWASPYWPEEERSNRLYRPLTLATFALNFLLGGPSPMGFHLVNALLHGGVAVLLFRLLDRHFAARALSWSAAALFAVHPVLTEAVAGVVGRADILAALFVLGALLTDRSIGRGDPPGRRRWWTATLVLSFLGMLAKENALVFPALLLLTDRMIGPPAGVPPRGRRWELVSAFAVAAIYLGLRTRVLGSIMETASIPVLDNPVAGASLWSRSLTAVALAGKYFGLFLLPVRLSADYSYRQILPVTSAADLRFLLGAAVVIGLLAVLGILSRRVPPLAWGIGFAACSFFLVSNLAFPIGTLFAERLLYLPAAGLCAAVGVLIASVAAKRPRGAGLLMVGVLSVLAARTWARNRDWKDDLSLFESAARVSPESARVRYNLGNAYRRRGDLPRAEENYRACLRIYPEYAPAQRNLAFVLTDSGRSGEAIDLLRKALEKEPDRAPLYTNLGNAFLGAGDVVEAEKAYLKAVQLDPSAADPRNNLGRIYQERNESAAAVTAFREAIRLDPDRVAFRINLGNVLLTRGEAAAAEDVFQEVVRRAPEAAAGHRGLGEALLTQGRMSEAERELGESLKRDPNQWQTPALLGYLHQKRGEPEPAIRYYRDSLRIRPDQYELLENLGILYLQTPDGRGQAKEQFQKCLALHPPPAVEQRVRDLLRRIEEGSVGSR